MPDFTLDVSNKAKSNTGVHFLPASAGKAGKHVTRGLLVVGQQFMI